MAVDSTRVLVIQRGPKRRIFKEGLLCGANITAEKKEIRGVTTEPSFSGKEELLHQIT